MTILVLLLVTQDFEQPQIDRRKEALEAWRETPQGIYDRYCAHCHGDDARGGGRLWASELSPKPPDLAASKLDVAALARFISEGSAASGRSSLCPPWGRTIAPEDVRRLVQHLLLLRGQTFAPTPETPRPANPVGEPFPWAPAGVALAEAALLAWMLRRRWRTRRASYSAADSSAS